MGEVLVIGGGPAGSIAAWVLACSGQAVTLVESSRFPREKVCGECVSALGISVLQRLGLADRLLSVGVEKLTRVSLASTSGQISSHQLRQEMWGISRSVMDPLLLNAAAEAGTRIIQPARVEKIEPRSDGVDVTWREGSNLTEREFSHIILAAGKTMGTSESPTPTSDLGVKGHFHGVKAQRDTIYLYGLHGHYGGLAPIGNDLWNVAWSVPATAAKRAKGDLKALWAERIQSSPFLRDAMSGATQVGTFLASPLPRYPVRRDFSPRILPVGNAAAALEPIGGEGMGLAMRSAELAADALLQAIQTHTEVDTRKLTRAYQDLWNMRRTTCRAVALGMSNPWLGRVIPGLSNLLPGLTRQVMAAMGK